MKQENDEMPIYAESQKNVPGITLVSVTLLWKANNSSITRTGSPDGPGYVHPNTL